MEFIFYYVLLILSVNMHGHKWGTTVTNAFQKKLGESYCNPNKTWVDKGSKFYNRSTEPSLGKNAI